LATMGTSSIIEILRVQPALSFTESPMTLLHRRSFRLPTLVALGLGLGGVAPSQAQSPPKVLTVFAAASLTESFQELGASLQAKTPGSSVVFNFAGSSSWPFSSSRARRRTCSHRPMTAG